MASLDCATDNDVLPSPAPLADSTAEVLTASEPQSGGGELVENPIDWSDGDPLAPAAPVEEGDGAGVGGEDGDEPPASALAVVAAVGGEEPERICDALVQRLAAGNTYSEEEVGLVAEIGQAVLRARDCQADLDVALFDIGRCAEVLYTQFDWTLKQIGEVTQYSESRISQIRNGYLAFPTTESRMGMSFSACLEARKVHARLPKAEKTKVTPTDVLREIQTDKLSVREASAHFHQKALKQAKDEALLRYETELAGDPELAGRAHNRDCLDVLREMPEKSVKLFNADPPYAQFLKVDHEGYVSGRAGGNGLRTDCANNVGDKAVPLTIEIFRLARRVVRDDGCLVLWSAGMHEDRPEVILAAREAGWRVGFAGYWKKHLTQPCKFDWPWTTCVERFLVFYPVGGAEPFDHSQELSRSDVITPDDLDAIASFKSPSQMAHGDFVSGRKNVGDVHMFEKPVGLGRFFIEKLTMPGDQVVDLFGCSGNFCIAAEHAKRPWTYIELNEDNFKWGVGRMTDARKQGVAAEEEAADMPF